MHDNLQCKPYRLISKGLGEGYLAKDFFTAFKNPKLTYWLSVHKPSTDVYNRVCEALEAEGKYDKLADYKQYYKDCCDKVELALKERTKQILDDENNYIDLDFVTPELLKKLQIYYDAAGYPHALPQYYRNKLFRPSNEKNIYQFEIQALLEQSARLHDNKIIQEEAATLGICIPDE